MSLYRLTIVTAALYCSIILCQLSATRSLPSSTYDSDISQSMHRYDLTNPKTSLKTGGIMDYRFSRIADAKYKTTVSIDSVLEDINDRVLNSPHPLANLTVSLAENYLTETGFKQLVDFLMTPDNIDVSRTIKHINLRNNRIRAVAQDDISRLLKFLPELTLDLSINYLFLSELSMLTPEEKKRITDRTY
jgi:hypothetical protein